MAYTPRPAGPKNLREFFHYLWKELGSVGTSIGDEGGTLPPDPPPTPGHEHWHDNLINVTPNQHHPQLHDLDSHTDVDFTGSPALEEGQGIYYDADLGQWRNHAPYQESWPTGLANGGELNIGPGIDDIEVITGLAAVVNSYTSPLDTPTLKGLKWDQINEPITAAPSVAGSVVWFSIYDTGVLDPINPDNGGTPVFVGALHQYPTPPSPTLAKQEVFLGVAIHNGDVWKEISNPKVINQTAETLRELVITVLGPSFIIQGGVIHEEALFTLSQDAGSIWENNRNWHNSKSDPNREPLPASDPIMFRYVTQDFSAVGALTDTITPDFYDVAGVVTPVPLPPLNTTIQRLYIDPANNYWMLYGQNVYTSFAIALASVDSDSANTVVPFILQNSILLGYIVAEEGATDWGPNASCLHLPSSSGGGGSAGIPITNHNDLAGIGPDDHHPAMQAVGNFVQGTTYNKGDEVFNGNSISEAKVDGVTSSPFVAPVGEPFNIFQGTMSDTAQLAKQIIFGNRYLSDNAFFISGSRVNTVVGNKYDMYSIQNIGLPNQIVTLLRSFTATTNGWESFNIDATAVGAGVQFDVIAIVQEPDPTPIEVIASYSYLTPQNPVNPIAGQIQHSRSQSDLMQISYTDNDVIDRTVLIQGLSVGDTIDIGAFSYAVQSNSDQVTYANIVVAPAVTSTAGIQDITFETVTATPITVAEDLVYWPTSNAPQVQGLKGVDIPYQDIVPDTNAYGVDLLVQDAYVPDSAEWWLKIIAAG